MKEKLENLKEEDSNIKVFRSIKNKDGTSTFTIDLYIPRAMAEKFLKSGFSESETRMKFTIHSRNFNRREDRGERGDRRGGRGRGNKRGCKHIILMIVDYFWGNSSVAKHYINCVTISMVAMH